MILWSFFIGILEKNGMERLSRDCSETVLTKAEKIKAIMRDNPTISIPSIGEKVGLSSRGVKYHIEKMKGAGEIKREGGDYGGK